MIEVTISSGEDLLIEINPEDVLGHPTSVDGESLTAFSADVSTIENGVVLDKEGPSYSIRCKVMKETILDTPVDITIKADADLGEGVEEISDIVRVTVLALKATALGLSAHGVPKE